MKKEVPGGGCWITYSVLIGSPGTVPELSDKVLAAVTVNIKKFNEILTADAHHQFLQYFFNKEYFFNEDTVWK